jgi:hypothetical protein
MTPINETPAGKLQRYLIGDLGVAVRHLERIRRGILEPVPAVLDEIENSVLRCIARIERDVPCEGSARSLLHMQADYDLEKLKDKK